MYGQISIYICETGYLYLQQPNVRVTRHDQPTRHDDTTRDADWPERYRTVRQIWTSRAASPPETPSTGARTLPLATVTVQLMPGRHTPSSGIGANDDDAAVSGTWEDRRLAAAGSIQDGGTKGAATKMVRFKPQDVVPESRKGEEKKKSKKQRIGKTSTDRPRQQKSVQYK